jgi:hypothetical protein
MTISIMDLFSRQDIATSAGQRGGEIISVRNSLANHIQGFEIGLREAHRRFLTPADGNGRARGCHDPSQLIAGDLAYAVPSWVPAHDHETRTVEGILRKSKVTHKDFPLKPWHTYYDWNFFVRVDKQYTYLLSKSNIQYAEEDLEPGDFECEWDTGFLPSWAWPQDGDRIWMVGRWIYDCGHPEIDEHGIKVYRTEIHPPKAVASFRREAIQFAGNSGPTRANNAVLYIGQKGGYWQQSINDQDYAFDLYLPAKPYAEAVPVWNIVPMTGNLPVQPNITPYPADEPKVLRVVIPLRSATPHPEEYGAIISAGWSDPRQTESVSIQRVRVRVIKLYIDSFYDISPDEWHIYIGINGRWRVHRGLSGPEEELDFSVDLDLHPDDKIHLTACGFEEDILHDYMGDASEYTWDQISDRNLNQARREEIEDDVFWQLAGSINDENDVIGYFSIFHPSTDRSVRVPFNRTSRDLSDYRIVYLIEDR